MSRCWCKCEAGLGQCGPKVPRLKSLFGSPKPNDEASLRRWDRQAELQIIWDEIGEEKTQKLEELRQMIAAAVDKVYDRALEEGVRRRTALEENVINSEKRLAEILGPDSAKLTALGDVDMEFMLSWLSTQEGLPSTASTPSQLPLQARLDMNLSRLHELDSERLGAYGWVGGLVVMVELRHRVLQLRETLNLPPCDSQADLDKILIRTMDDLNSLYPGKAAALQYNNSDVPAGEQKPVLQRLQKFYHALRAIESTWVETFAQKNSSCFGGGVCGGGGGEARDGDNLQDHMEKAAQTRLRNIEEKRNLRKRTRDVQRHKSESPVSTTTGSMPTVAPACKAQSSKNKITRPNTPSSEESHSLELLGQNIINKIDTMNQHLKLTRKGMSETASCSSVSQGTSRFETVAKPAEKAPLIRPVAELPQQIHDSGVAAAAHPQPAQQGQLLGKSVRTPTSVRTRSAIPIIMCPSVTLSEREMHHSAELPIEVAGLPQADLLPCTARESLGKVKPADLFAARIPLAGAPKAPPSRSPVREPLRTLPNCTVALAGNPSSQNCAKRSGPPPPPPPPPPVPPPGPGLALLKRQSSNLKRSVKIGRLYRSLKTKIEGAAQVHAISGPGSTSRRLSANGSREGMAEALAEITKKSSYFQKIEHDVQRYRDSIEESKTELERFETADMDQLLRFHKKLESILENLTDETQVLARFKGFPSNKLETLRLAAALYSRLLSMAQELEKWILKGQVSEQIDKITRYFDKIKKELDVVEGTKDEDYKRFTNQKIKFDFSIIGRIKEAMVGLSSRCLLKVLEECRRENEGDNRTNGLRPVDVSRQKFSSHMLWKAFQLAYRVYNFAGGHDDQSEKLIAEIASEIDSYPADVWL